MYTHGYASLPSWPRGFDSHRPLHITALPCTALHYRAFPVLTRILSNSYYTVFPLKMTPEAPPCGPEGGRANVGWHDGVRCLNKSVGMVGRNYPL